MSIYETKLKIADTIIQMQSNFALEQLTEEEERLQVTERFDNFSYSGGQKLDILINIEIVDKLVEDENLSQGS